MHEENACCEPPQESITENAIQDTKTLRRDLDVLLQSIKNNSRKSRERSLADTKITEAIMWLGMDLKALNEPNPYPESKDPTSLKIESTADGLTI